MKKFIRVLSVILAVGAASQAVAQFTIREGETPSGSSVFGTRERLHTFVEIEISQLETKAEPLNRSDQQTLTVLKKLKSWLNAQGTGEPGP